MYNYLKLLIFNLNCHKKKKKDDSVTFFAKNLLNVTDISLFNLKAEKYYEMYLIRIIYTTYEDYKSHISNK